MGFSPLSDRAPRNNGNVRRPSQYAEAKATLGTNNRSQLLRSPRAWHANKVNDGTWENLKGFERMQNYNIEKDHFKTSINAPKVVRLICSSEEVG